MNRIGREGFRGIDSDALDGCPAYVKRIAEDKIKSRWFTPAFKGGTFHAFSSHFSHNETAHGR